MQALADRCPHRGTRLSIGRVADGRLECAYHGWQFGAGGACRAVPALPGFTPGPAHAAQAYEANEAHGLVWVRLEKSDARLPEIAGAPRRRIVSGPHEVATSAPRVVENFLDMSHFPFVHEGLLGDRGHAEVPHYEVTSVAGRPRRADVSRVAATGARRRRWRCLGGLPVRSARTVQRSAVQARGRG